MIVTLDARFMSVRDPDSGPSLGKINAFDLKKEQRTGHHKQIWQLTLLFSLCASEASRVVALASREAPDR